MKRLLDLVCVWYVFSLGVWPPFAMVGIFGSLYGEYGNPDLYDYFMILMILAYPVIVFVAVGAFLYFSFKKNQLIPFILLLPVPFLLFLFLGWR